MRRQGIPGAAQKRTQRGRPRAAGQQHVWRGWHHGTVAGPLDVGVQGPCGASLHDPTDDQSDDGPPRVAAPWMEPWAAMRPRERSADRLGAVGRGGVGRRSPDCLGRDRRRRLPTGRHPEQSRELCRYLAERHGLPGAPTRGAADRRSGGALALRPASLDGRAAACGNVRCHQRCGLAGAETRTEYT